MSFIRMQYSQVVRSSTPQIDLNSVNESIQNLYSGMKSIEVSIDTNMKNQLREFEKTQEAKINNMINEFCNRQENFIKVELQETKKNLKEELKQDITYKLQVINNQFHEYKARLIYSQLDLIKIISPHTPPSKEQLQLLHESYQTHTNVEISFQNIQSYVQNLFNVKQ